MRDPAAPLAAARTVSGDGGVDGQRAAAIGGYTILEAGSLDEAVGLVRSHPFLARGGSLQAMAVGGYYERSGSGTMKSRIVATRS